MLYTEIFLHYCIAISPRFRFYKYKAFAKDARMLNFQTPTPINRQFYDFTILR